MINSSKATWPAGKTSPLHLALEPTIYLCSSGAAGCLGKGIFRSCSGLCHLCSCSSSSQPASSRAGRASGGTKTQSRRQSACSQGRPAQASPPARAPTPPPACLLLSWLLSPVCSLQLPSLLLLLSGLCPGLPEAACQSDCMSGLCPGHQGLGSWPPAALSGSGAAQGLMFQGGPENGVPQDRPRQRRGLRASEVPWD